MCTGGKVTRLGLQVAPSNVKEGLCFFKKTSPSSPVLANLPWTGHPETGSSHPAPAAGPQRRLGFQGQRRSAHVGCLSLDAGWPRSPGRRPHCVNADGQRPQGSPASPPALLVLGLSIVSCFPWELTWFRKTQRKNQAWALGSSGL